MKSNSSFNLSKTAKKMIANTPREKRGIFKAMMIQAELAAAIKPVIRDRQPKPVKEIPSDQTNN
jgi:hypothetical protein